MSLDQLLMLPPGYGFDSAGGDPPTVYTLVIDDLLTRHYPATSQRFKLTATAGTTDWIELDDDAPLRSAAAMASDMQDKLQALTGYSGKVTVSGASSEAGDKYTFPISFDASLGAVTLDFDSSSQWFPTITLGEETIQDGIPDEPETFANIYVSVYAANDGDNVISNGSGNDVTISVASGIIVGISPSSPSGYPITSGGIGFAAVEFTRTTGGVSGETFSLVSGDVFFGFVDGTDAVAGQPEIHSIVASPATPTGGNLSIGDSGAVPFYYNFPDPLNTVSAAWSKTEGTNLGDGSLQFTADVNADADSSELAPANVDLTAPEITHSIS